MNKYTYKTNEPKNLNMHLKKNQALTEEGKLYIQNILVGGNAFVANNSHEFGKGRGRVFLSYKKWNSAAKKHEETIVAAQFPEDAMSGLKNQTNQHKPSRTPYPELIHTLINGGDAVNNLLTRDICVQVYAGTYYSNPGCSSAAASINKVVVCGYLNSRLGKGQIENLVAFLNEKAKNEGWTGTVSGILQCGKILEMSFCFNPVITAYHRIGYSLVQKKLVAAFNQFANELPFKCKFKAAPEHYKMFVPGTTDAARKCHANILYVNKELTRASLETAQKNMHIEDGLIIKGKREYEEECLLHPYDKHHAIKVSRLNQARANCIVDFLREWFLSGNRKFKYQETMSFLAVYGSACFEKNGGFVGKMLFAATYHACHTLLEDAVSQGNILIDLIDDKDIRRVLGKVSIGCRQYHRIETISKTLKLSEAEQNGLQKALQNNADEYRTIKIQELRKKTQNKTRDSEAKLRKETKILKRKKCVELYVCKQMSCEEIAKVVTGRGFGLRTLKDNIENWCKLYPVDCLTKKEEILVSVETKTAAGIICATKKSYPLNVLSAKCWETLLQWVTTVWNMNWSAMGNRYLRAFEFCENFLFVKNTCGDVSSYELNNKSERKSSSCIPNYDEFPQMTEWNSEKYLSILSILENPSVHEVLNKLGLMRIKKNATSHNQKLHAQSKKKRFCTRTLPLCDKLQSFLNKAVPHLLEQIYKNTFEEKETSGNTEKVFFAAKSLIFHWVEAAYPAAVRVVDRQLKWEKAAAKVDIQKGGEVSIDDEASEYISHCEFAQDFVPSAIVKSGLRCVRSLLKKHQFFGVVDSVCLDDIEMSSFNALLYKKTMGDSVSFHNFFEKMDDSFDFIGWDSLPGVVDELIAVSTVPDIEDVTIVPMPSVCA